MDETEKKRIQLKRMRAFKISGERVGWMAVKSRCTGIAFM
jgi:hypothetical protein